MGDGPRRHIRLLLQLRISLIYIPQLVALRLEDLVVLLLLLVHAVKSAGEIELKLVQVVLALLQNLQLPDIVTFNRFLIVYGAGVALEIVTAYLL